MGYYISTLLKGEKYELNGETIEFIEKVGRFYHFYLCEYNKETFRHNPTQSKISYTANEINYIKRAKNLCEAVCLKRIGRDRVWSRNL